MVERPIKKSERQAAESKSAGALEHDVSQGGQDAAAQTVEAGNTDRPQRRDRSEARDRSKGSGRRDRGEQPRPPINPALMRGPKPAKAKPPVVAEEAPLEAEAEEAPSEG